VLKEIFFRETFDYRKLSDKDRIRFDYNNNEYKIKNKTKSFDAIIINNIDFNARKNFILRVHTNNLSKNSLKAFIEGQGNKILELYPNTEKSCYEIYFSTDDKHLKNANIIIYIEEELSLTEILIEMQ
jgi:hypothetical protein